MTTWMAIQRISRMMGRRSQAKNDFNTRYSWMLT